MIFYGYLICKPQIPFYPYIHCLAYFIISSFFYHFLPPFLSTSLVLAFLLSFPTFPSPFILSYLSFFSTSSLFPPLSSSLHSFIPSSISFLLHASFYSSLPPMPVLISLSIPPTSLLTPFFILSMFLPPTTPLLPSCFSLSFLTPSPLFSFLPLCLFSWFYYYG